MATKTKEKVSKAPKEPSKKMTKQLTPITPNVEKRCALACSDTSVR